MKIVILDSLTLGDDLDLSIFEQIGTIEIYPTSTIDEAAKRLETADIAIVNKVPMNNFTLENAANLKLIALTATGYNNVDLEFTSERNISITNVAGYSTQSVVQHTFALLFYVMEKLSYYDAYVKSGDYSLSPVFTNFDKVFMELYHKTWGIIGLGEIGRNVATVAKAFGCNVVYYSTTGHNQNPHFQSVSFEDLLSKSDIVSIHAPLNSTTENLINYEALSKMKKNAILLNLGRGPIINEIDLARALNENLIEGAGLDVICKEPIEKNNPLMTIKDSTKLIITPHIAWATYEARTRLMQEVFENIQAFLRGERRNRID